MTEYNVRRYPGSKWGYKCCMCWSLVRIRKDGRISKHRWWGRPGQGTAGPCPNSEQVAILPEDIR